MSKGCVKCGFENADEAGFCRGCGAELGGAGDARDAPDVPDTSDETVAMRACRVCAHLNRAGARFCAKCGSDSLAPLPMSTGAVAPASDATVPRTNAPAPAPVSPPALPPSSMPAAARPTRAAVPGPSTRRPVAIWIGLGAVVVALGVAGAWWLNSTRSPPLPTFDSAPPPSAVGAHAPALPASPPPEPHTAPAPVAAAPAPASAAPAVDVAPPPPATGLDTAASVASPEPAEKAAAGASRAERELPAASDNVADSAARDAKARALREQRVQRAQAAAQAEAGNVARRRADESRARPPQAAPAATLPSRAAPAPTNASPAPPRSVLERCSSGNPLVRGICESRECVRSEHAGELVCQRIKAADDRRREQ